MATFSFVQLGVDLWNTLSSPNSCFFVASAHLLFSLVFSNPYEALGRISDIVLDEWNMAQCLLKSERISKLSTLRHFFVLISKGYQHRFFKSSIPVVLCCKDFMYTMIIFTQKLNFKGLLEMSNLSLLDVQRALRGDVVLSSVNGRKHKTRQLMIWNINF